MPVPSLRSKRYSIAVETAFPRTGTRWERFQHCVAIAGPIGFIPWVPATFASAAVAVVCWLAPPHWPVVAVLTLALFFAGGFTASTSERLTGQEDPRNVVIDELAGQLLTFLLVVPLSWRLALAGFVLFRLLDVVKPWPARRLEHLPGGWGIMSDDIASGLYAAGVLYLLQRLVG